MYYLNSDGFAVATGSACTTASEEASHVLLAMKVNPKLAKSTIRLSLNTNITKQDLKAFVDALNRSIKIIGRTVQDL